jgi:hypothetical protein
MTRFVLTGSVKNPSALGMLREDQIYSGTIEEKLSKLNLEIERIETVGDEVTYYLKESTSGPKLLCD